MTSETPTSETPTTETPTTETPTTETPTAEAPTADAMIAIRGDGPLAMVDDDEVDTMLVARCHQRSKLDRPFISFDHGESFLRYLDSTLDGGRPLPSLVLLDINMPGMDGFEVMAAMRANEAFRNVPITLFFSNSDSPADREQAVNHGSYLQEKFSSVADCIAFLDQLAEGE